MIIVTNLGNCCSKHENDGFRNSAKHFEVRKKNSIWELQGNFIWSNFKETKVQWWEIGEKKWFEYLAPNFFNLVSENPRLLRENHESSHYQIKDR